MNILVAIILHVRIQNVFEWAYSTFCKCWFRLTHCRVNFYSFSAAKFLELSSKFCPLIYPSFFGLLFLIINFETVLTVSLESFVFIPLASTVLSNKSWRASKICTPFFSFANLWTYARFIHQIFILNLGNALTSFEFTCRLCEPSIWSLWM